jgi:hypothetical protein
MSFKVLLFVASLVLGNKKYFIFCFFMVITIASPLKWAHLTYFFVQMYPIIPYETNTMIEPLLMS